jgi:hypothetical protein
MKFESGSQLLCVQTKPITTPALDDGTWITAEQKGNSPLAIHKALTLAATLKPQRKTWGRETNRKAEGKRNKKKGHCRLLHKSWLEMGRKKKLNRSEVEEKGALSNFSSSIQQSSHSGWIKGIKEAL